MSLRRIFVPLVLTALLMLAALGALGAPAAADEPAYHVVQWGETLASIARKYGVTVRRLVEANGLESANVIYTGQRLTIPAAAPSTTHVVRPGESLLTIARHYGISIWAIAERNQIRNVNLVFVGQSLVIPAGEEPAPAPTPTLTATPTPAQAQTTELFPEAIVIYDPRSEARVVSPLTVTGWGSASENTLTIYVLDDGGLLIGQGFAVIDAEFGEFGPYEGTVEFRPPDDAEVGRVQVYSTSPRDGAIVHLSSVAVRFR